MDETLAPARNFSISLGDRVRALAGPPAYIRRRRELEDLEEALIARLCESKEASSGVRALTRLTEKTAFTRDLARLNDLIRRHNRYYPIEANLPIHPRTGGLVDGGRPWTPLDERSAEDLVRASLGHLIGGSAARPFRCGG